MQQLTLISPHQLAWSDVAPPAVNSTEAAVVRPIAVATCDFDHLIVGGLTNLPFPMAIGHECVAEVVEVGSSVERVTVGDRVIVPYQVSCGTCAACRRDDTSSCERVPWLSGYGLGLAGGGFGGAMSDLLEVPFADAMLVPLPDGVSPATAAAIGCNLPDTYRCVEPLLQHPGAAVLIMGGAFHSIGLYAVELAHALGASRVDYVDRVPKRAAQAAALGARVIDRPADVATAEYPVTVDASMDVALLSTAIRATASSGVCTVSTMYVGDDVPVPLFHMFQNCITLRTGQPHTRALMGPVLDLIAQGRIRPDLVTAQVVAWDAAPEAFGRGQGKVVCVRD